GPALTLVRAATAFADGVEAPFLQYFSYLTIFLGVEHRAPNPCRQAFRRFGCSGLYRVGHGYLSILIVDFRYSNRSAQSIRIVRYRGHPGMAPPTSPLVKEVPCGYHRTHACHCRQLEDE